jgi:hypothetical protein
MQRVMLVARHVNGGQDPAWVSPMTSALLGIGDPPDVEGTNKRCSAVAIDAMTPTLPPTPKAKRR